MYESRATEPDRPNFVLLMGDDHGWDETGYNGHPHLHTPVLDEMAASGLRLDRFYSAHPTCSPTRGSVMTGRHPNRYGTFTPNYSIRPEEITLARLLRDAGYMCGHFGKWHLGPVKLASPTSPGAMGFDQWLSHDNFFELNPMLSRNGRAPEQIKGEGSEIIVRESIQFIDEAKKNGQPFFAVIWFGSPHEPYSAFARDLVLYDDLPGEYSGQQVKLTSNDTGQQIRRSRRDVLRERYAEITAMDRSIGQLRDWLAEHRLSDDTLIWYCGDNGTPRDGIVTSPLRGQKNTMYEGGIRVPGLIEWPTRIRLPHISDVNTVTSDILPTICQLAGVPVPDRPLDGIDLAPLMDGSMLKRPVPVCFWAFNHQQESTREPYIQAGLQTGTTATVKKMGDLFTRNFRNFHHPEITEQDYAGSRVILDNRYKLIVQENGTDVDIQLFDVRSDPSEKKNLIKSKPLIASRLESRLRHWQTSVLNSLTEADYQ